MSSLIEAGLPPRTYEAGRLRTGDKDADGKPRRLNGFRLTTHARALAEQCADLYEGDEVRQWGRQWEVYTRCREITVALPPGCLVISQAMMRWTGGGPAVVCNGLRTSKPVIGPCMCPQPDDPGNPDSVWAAVNERRRLAAQKTPAGCKAHTWIKVTLPDIDGFGIWTLHSVSENAAAEILQQAVLLERARAAGQFLPASVALEYKESRVDGLLRQYNVPVLRVNKSVRAIAELGAAFGGRPLAEQLPAAPGERRAITAAPAANVHPQAAPPAPAAPPAGEDVPLPPEPVADEDVPDATMLDDRTPMTARQIADLAAKAATRDDIEWLVTKAEADQVDGQTLPADPRKPGRREPVVLREYLRSVWKVLPTKAREAS